MAHHKTVNLTARHLPRNDRRLVSLNIPASSTFSFPSNLKSPIRGAKAVGGRSACRRECKQRDCGCRCNQRLLRVTHKNCWWIIGGTGSILESHARERRAFAIDANCRQRRRAVVVPLRGSAWTEDEVGLIRLDPSFDDQNYASNMREIIC